MGAPDFVPLKAGPPVRTYQSPPRRPGSWRADRPGDLDTVQPLGDGLGNPGPDAGFALTIAQTFADRIHLQPGEHRADALRGAAAVAIKRSAHFGRAPVVHDVEIALTAWGFLAAHPDPSVLAVRKPLFAECSHPHFYSRLRAIADAVPIELLAQPTDRALADAATFRPTAGSN
jgi:hypothetical protein